MKAAAALLLLFAMFDAHAEIKGVVALPDGATLRLHDTAGPCVGEALMAEYVMPGKPNLVGCWLARGQGIQIAFLDGVFGFVARDSVRKPEAT